MKVSEIAAVLKNQVGREAILTFSDGEVARGKVVCVLEDEGAVIFDLIRSNRPDKYERSDVRPSLWARLADVESCEPQPGPPEPTPPG